MEPNEVYQRVLGIVNKFLSATVGLSVGQLEELDPTIETIAKKLKVLASVLNGIASGSFEDENMHINSLQCCVIMEQIAVAVSKRQEEEVSRLVEQLVLHTNVP